MLTQTYIQTDFELIKQSMFFSWPFKMTKTPMYIEFGINCSGVLLQTRLKKPTKNIDCNQKEVWAR